MIQYETLRIREEKTRQDSCIVIWNNTPKPHIPRERRESTAQFRQLDTITAACTLPGSRSLLPPRASAALVASPAHRPPNRRPNHAALIVSSPHCDRERRNSKNSGTHVVKVVVILVIIIFVVVHVLEVVIVIVEALLVLQGLASEVVNRAGNNLSYTERS